MTLRYPLKRTRIIVYHVIKLKLKPNGTYTKQVVFTKTVNGISLNKQRDFLRELIHIKFPNTVKLLIDAQGAGAGLPSMFYESWEYTDPKTGVVTEYPPIISDDEKSVDIIRQCYSAYSWCSWYEQFRKPLLPLYERLF